MTYKETVDYLYSRLPVFHHIGKAAYKANLDNILRLSERFGNPEKKFKTIHVAGTNGKGSVSHMLASVFQYAGYKTGLYTSPHLIDFCERIKIDGKEIPQTFVVQFVEQYLSLIEEMNPSFFELITAMGFVYFAHEKIDIAIVETGLGGRLDATNIICPELSVITNISYDHMDILGNTLEKIAHEKAGIIKKEIPVVIGESLPETEPVFREKAQELNAPIVFAQELYQSETLDSDFWGRKLKITDKHNGTTQEYEIDLGGKYQEKNIATVLAAINVLKNRFELTENSIFQGMKHAAGSTGLRGRWQVLKQTPTVIADTGHNEAGIRLLMEQLKTLSFKKLHIVFGMVKDKNIEKILDILPHGAVYYFTRANVIRALDENDLFNLAKARNLQGNSFHTIREAVNAAIHKAGENDLIFIGGSTFVAAEAIEYLEN